MSDGDSLAGAMWLSWLADAPMFIDDQQVGDFYDAVVGPAFRTAELQISKNRGRQSETSADVRLGATLRALFPWLQIDGGAAARQATTVTQQEGENIVLQPVESATRQLVKLSLHYLVNQPDRIRFVAHESLLPGQEAIAVARG
jgi:hypothetical protein